MHNTFSLRAALALALVLVLAAALPLRRDTAAPSAAVNICGTNATIGAAVIRALNLSYAGLDAVASAAAAGDLGAACEALAAYYYVSNTTSWLRVPPVTPSSRMAGGAVDDMVLHDVFVLAGVAVTATVPRNADGGIDWLDKGPRDDVEFMNCLNRHDSFTELLTAWRATGNPLYASYFDALLVDWASHLPCPDALSGGAACVPLGLTSGAPCSWGEPPGAQACKTGTMESPWRSLEMGIRMMGPWPAAFFGFQGAAAFSTSARALAVLVAAEHNAALTVDGGHPGRGTPNWEMTQWQGLVTSAVSFPELHNASGALALATAQLTALLNDGVYPDGVETEQASGYDMGTAGDFFGTLRLLRDAGVPPPPASFTSRVEAMWNYGAFAADPAGCLPRNGDSDRCGNGYSEEVAAYFGRPDWTYAKTNGQSGARPTVGPSIVFPWSGQAIFRSGWDAAATWIWFDIGPYGSSGHAHRDKLSLTLHARGAMLLVDSGRFAYQGTDLSAVLHREYASTTRAHNTLTIDGLDQAPLPAVADAPVPDGSWSTGAAADTAFASMSLYPGLSGNATHTRALHYQHPPPGATDGDWVVVVDVVRGDRPRALQAAWHAHPNASGSLNVATGVAVVGGVIGATGAPADAQICVVPARGPTLWSGVRIVSGQAANATTGVEWQGWYSASYDDASAAPTLLYDARAAPSEAAFAWLLVPTSTRAPCDGASAVLVDTRPTSVTVEVRVGAGPPVNVTLAVAMGL